LRIIRRRLAMPIDYLRSFTGPQRTESANRRLGRSLAFVAGTANAGGFLAVGQYTSHMSGVVSAMADDIALGNIVLFIAGLSSLLSFLAGAALSALLINWGRRHHAKMVLLASLLGMFFLGGLTGALGFKHVGFISTIPLAALLMVLAAVPVLDDLVGRRQS
jgi:uncharacterized membrane protein YoaK (UPF0700 family)